MQPTTLLFLRRNHEILLAMKKRGHGIGKWNGVGGKVATDESIEAATIRECQEEIGVTPLDFQKVAELEFSVPSRDSHHYTHVYMAQSWQGEPTEREEMAPRWFDIEAIPYAKMWSDDRLWLPKILAGEKLSAYFLFDEAENVVSVKWRPLAPLQH